MSDTKDIQLQSADDAMNPAPEVKATPKVQASVMGLGKSESGIHEIAERISHGPATLQIMMQNRLAAEDGRLLVHPEKYLEASFEVFLFMLAICWIITAMCAAASDQCHEAIGPPAG